MTRLPVAAAPPQGPRNPIEGAPARALGSVRRTTSIDQRRGEPGAPMEVLARGRDLLTRPDGSTDVLAEVELRATIDAGTVAALASDPPVPGLEQLVGASVSKGFRQRVDHALPDERRGATVLHLLLDDLPMATLISGYGSTREQTDWTMSPEAAERMADLCAGWARGATMLDRLGQTGVFPIPVGPPAPDLGSADDPLAWHAVPPMPPRSVRRRRRLDVVGGTPLAVDAHFRDSHLGTDELEDVLHEYSLAATIDPATQRVLSAGATAQVLPWPECPSAVASAGRIVGLPVDKLRLRVISELTGTSTCTHLNDVLRSLHGVLAMARPL